MATNIFNIEKTINQLTSNIEYLNEHISTVDELSHTTLPLQRKIKELNQKIKIQRNQSPQNKSVISQLCEEEQRLNLDLQLISKVELDFSSLLELMAAFLKTHNVRKDLFTKKYSDKELLVLRNFHELSMSNSLSKIRSFLEKYITEISDSDLINLLNSKLNLLGYKRFYYEDGKINSKYCKDLKAILLNILDKRKIKELIGLIKKQHQIEQGQLKAIEVLKTIIKYYNKRQI